MRVGIFSLGGKNLLRSDLDHSTYFNAKNNILQILNIKKTKLSGPMCANSMKLK